MEPLPDLVPIRYTDPLMPESSPLPLGNWFHPTPRIKQGGIRSLYRFFYFFSAFQNYQHPHKSVGLNLEIFCIGFSSCRFVP
jgi:hypothetical protein